MKARNLLIAFVVLLFFGSSTDAQEAKQREDALRISRETTFLTEPLDERGYVDFMAAANQRFSQGVTTENNFEVSIRRIMPVDAISENMRDEYFKRLGIAVPIQDEVLSFSASFQKYAKDPHRHHQIRALYNRLQTHPWTPDDYPTVEKWLDREKPRLDELVAACDRSRCYTPYVFIPSQDKQAVEVPLLMALLPTVQERRDLGRALHIRIHRNLGVGDLDLAWKDTLAGLKMARLTGSGFTLIELLVGIAIDGMMFDSAVRILSHDNLNEDLASRVLADLRSLDYLPSAKISLGFAERALSIELIQVLSRQKNMFDATRVINNLFGQIESDATNLVVFQTPGTDPEQTPKSQFQIKGESLSELIDWNEAAKQVNLWYDRMCVVVGEEDFAKRNALREKLESEIPISEPANVFGLLSKAKNRQEMGKGFGNYVLSVTASTTVNIAKAQFESSERLDVLRLACAAIVYGRMNHIYPKSLDELVPQYLKAIPADRFSTKPIQYRSRHDGFVVYSAGRNGKNDLGRGRDDTGDRKNVQWDDVVIRIKRPAR